MHLAFLADDLADANELARHVLVQADDVVEQLAGAAEDPVLVGTRSGPRSRLASPPSGPRRAARPRSRVRVDSRSHSATRVGAPACTLDSVAALPFSEALLASFRALRALVAPPGSCPFALTPILASEGGENEVARGSVRFNPMFLPRLRRSSSENGPMIAERCVLPRFPPRWYMGQGCAEPRPLNTFAWSKRALQAARSGADGGRISPSASGELCARTTPPTEERGTICRSTRRPSGPTAGGRTASSASATTAASYASPSRSGTAPTRS